METDIFLKEDSGWISLNIAALYGHLNLWITLLHNPKFDIHHASRNDSYKLVKFFADMGTDIILNHFGWNCLHIAVFCGHLNLCKTLILKRNFDVDIASNEGGRGR